MTITFFQFRQIFFEMKHNTSSIRRL